MKNEINIIHEINNMYPNPNVELRSLGYGSLIIDEGGAKAFQVTICDAFAIVDESLRDLVDTDNNLKDSIADNISGYK